MQRTICFEVPSETSLFTPMQFQPRALTWLWMSGWSRWMRTHWVPFPRLVKAYDTSFVILGHTIEFCEPLHFVDADTIEVGVEMWASGRGRFVEAAIRYCGAGRMAAKGRWVLMPVRIQEAQSLAAQPMRLRDDLLALLQPEEVTGDKPQNPVPGRLAWIAEHGEVLAEYCHPFTVHRHHCEVADQWCFVDIPPLAAESREAMALAQMDRVEPLVAALSSPLRRIDVKLTRPLFAFDQAQIVTTAYRSLENDSLFFVHRITSELGAGQEHGVVIEEL